MSTKLLPMERDLATVSINSFRSINGLQYSRSGDGRLLVDWRVIAGHPFASADDASIRPARRGVLDEALHRRWLVARSGAWGLNAAGWQNFASVRMAGRQRLPIRMRHAKTVKERLERRGGATNGFALSRESETPEFDDGCELQSIRN